MANSRQPNSLYGDLNGQINALDLGARRLGALLDDYGAATVREAFAELRARAARLMRANIAELPDGTYSAEDFLDNDGIVDTPLKIALDLTHRRRDDDPRFLALGGAACAGPVNIALSTTVASCYVALKHIFRDVPANAGVLEPIDFVVPTTSILHARAPKPVGGYTETILRIIDVVFVALAEGGAEPRQRLRLRHDQRAVARRASARRAALGHVLVLRRRPWRPSRGRRAQPRQRADLDRDDPADRDPRGSLSGDVHLLGAAPRQRRAGPPPRRPRRDLRDRAARGAGRGLPVRRARQASRRPASSAAAPARSTSSPTSRTTECTTRRWPRRWSASSSARASGCASNRRAAAATARRRARRPRRSRRDVALGYETADACGAQPTAGTPPNDRAASDRRRRCRRHLHRCLLPRRGSRNLQRSPRCPRPAATRRRASSRASARAHAISPTIATIVHGTTVGNQRAARAQGRAHRRHHHAGFPRRARDAPPRPAAHLGPLGPVRAGRAARSPPRSRRAHARRRHDPRGGRPRRGARRRRASCSRAAPRRCASSSSTPTPTRRTSAPPPRRCARSGPTTMSTRRARSCRRSASSSVPRRRRSTPISSRWSRTTSSTSRTSLRGRRLRRRVAHRAVEWRRHDHRDGAAPAGAHRPVRPGGGVIASAHIAASAGFPQRHHLRHGRHQLRCVADRRGRDRAGARRPASISASSCARR